MRENKYNTATHSGKGSRYRDKDLSGGNGRLTRFIVLWLLVFFILSNDSFGQRGNGNIYKLSISEAVEFAKRQNKWVQAASIEQQAATQDRKDVYVGAFPAVTVNGSYQRFSDLTLFTNGLSDASTGPRKPGPNAASLGIDVLYNIYGGGRQVALRQEYSSRLQLTKVHGAEVSAEIGLQTALWYFDLVRLNELQKFISDQLKRAETRLTSINSLYRNQKVTRSDVLRAEVNLSNVQLSLQQNENDIVLANRKLAVLLNVPDSLWISPADSAAMEKPEPDLLLPLIERAGVNAFTLQKAVANLQVQRARLEGLESANRPTVSFYAAYGLNYPNYLFFPPVDQAYAIGFGGIKAQYNISSLYHNKSKVAAGKLRLKELEVQQEALQDNVQTEIMGYFIRYGEALTRIAVNEKSVEQARVNFRIVNTKYLNQLSLLTDLLDAG